jgi:RND family efflux transporter MFP subunit
MAIGVAVANAILLATFAEKYRLEGAAPGIAAVRGASSRLRPILMTTVAMIAGMIPVAFGAEQLAPLGRAVIGGLAASTLATLFVLPALFALVQRRAGTGSASLDPDDVMSRHHSGALGTLACVCVCLAGAAATVAAQAGGAPASIELAKVVSKPLSKTMTIPGDLTPYQGINIHAKVSGFVESIDVDRGSWVRKGQVLAVLSAPELRAQRAEADAKRLAVTSQQAEARAKLAAAQSTYQRLKAASATPGVVSGNDLENAQQSAEALGAQVRALESSAAAAEAAAKAVAELEAYLQITAPFDGVITERHAHPGSLVGPSTVAVVRLEQVSRLRLTVPVPESYVGSIQRGAPVEFTVSAFPRQVFHGTIARPAHSLDMKTRSMLVELDVTNPKQQLAPGMFAEVRWPVSRAQASLFVPTTAVVRMSERQFVIRVTNGVAEWVDVKRGETSDGQIEVFGELRAGDEVVRRGNDEIRHGSRIK